MTSEANTVCPQAPTPITDGGDAKSADGCPPGTDGTKSTPESDGQNPKARKHYITRSQGSAPPLSKKICKGDSLF